MSFQKVRELLGQKDLKGYQLGLNELTGQLVSYEPKKYTENGKPFQQAVIADEAGEVQKVKIYLGNGPEFQPTDVGTQQRFTSVKPNSFKNNMYYAAFWASMSPPTQLPASPQTPQNAPQSPNAPLEQYPKTQASTTKNEYNEREDARQLMIVRQSCLNRAVEMFLGSTHEVGWPEPDDRITHICQLAEKFRGYIYNGLGGMPNPDYAGSDIDPEEEAARAEQAEDDIPF